MKKSIKLLALLMSLSVVFYSCGGSEEATDETTDETTDVSPDEIIEEETDAPAGPSEDEIRTFLHSTEGTYGWDPQEGDISYDFFPDGRLHIQGPDGEATMWQGTWTLSGNKVTLISEDRDQNETLEVQIDGEKLILGGVTYTRYAP